MLLMLTMAGLAMADPDATMANLPMGRLRHPQWLLGDASPADAR